MGGSKAVFSRRSCRYIHLHRDLELLMPLVVRNLLPNPDHGLHACWQLLQQMELQPCLSRRNSAQEVCIASLRASLGPIKSQQLKFCLLPAWARRGKLTSLFDAVPGLEILKAFGNVDVSLGLTPEQLCEKVAGADALIIRSETQVRQGAQGHCQWPELDLCTQDVRQRRNACPCSCQLALHSLCFYSCLLCLQGQRCCR